MKTKLFGLLIVMCVCGLWGCASTKPVETAGTETLPAANPTPEKPTAVESKPVQLPARSAAPVAKTNAAPVSTRKVKTNDNVSVQPEPVAPKETTVAPKETTVAPKETTVAPREDHAQINPAELRVANAFDRNPYLSAMLKPLVPPQSTLTQAAAGFKNQRQFIAALHLSKNLIIPFDQIKIRATGNHRMSLSDSIRDIRPSLTKNLAKAEVNKAEQQAKDDESHAKDAEKKAEKLANNRKS
jgi:hypothetical protein